MAAKTSAEIKRVFGRLTQEHFSLFANQLDYESEVAVYQVPSGKMVELDGREFIGLKFITVEQFSFTTGSAETSKTLTVSYGIARDPLLPDVPSAAGQPANVLVEKTSPAPAGEWTSFTVSGDNVTLSGLTASTSYVFKIYYLFEKGYAKITVYSADETAKLDVLNENIGRINRLNQEDTRFGLKLGVTGLFPVPERYKIKIRVKAPTYVYWFGATASGVKTPYARVGLISLPVAMSDMIEYPESIKLYAKQQLIG